MARNVRLLRATRTAHRSIGWTVLVSVALFTIARLYHGEHISFLLNNDSDCSTGSEDAIVAQKHTIPSNRMSLLDDKDMEYIAVHYAADIAKGTFVEHIERNLTRMYDSEWHINLANLPRPCLVYSFGVGQTDKYTTFMSKEGGCQVYAFDPTVNHTRDWMPSVTFYPWGLHSRDSKVEWSHEVYGARIETAEFLTFPEIIARLGHDDGRTISAIKFDCEGCEYGAFRDWILADVDNPVLNLATEFHMSTTLGLATKQDVRRVYFAKKFMELQQCRLVKFARNGGFRRDRTILPVLLNAGVPAGVCCYEVGFECNANLYVHRAQ